MEELLNLINAIPTNDKPEGKFKNIFNFKFYYFISKIFFK